MAENHGASFDLINSIKKCFEVATEGTVDQLNDAVKDYEKKSGHKGDTKYLLGLIKDGNKRNLLHVAVQAGNENIVCYLLENCPQLASERESDTIGGAYPQRYATVLSNSYKRDKIVKQLLRYDLKGFRGGALHYGLLEGHADVITSYIEACKTKDDIKSALTEDVKIVGRLIQCAITCHDDEARLKAVKVITEHFPQEIIRSSQFNELPPAMILLSALNSENKSTTSIFDYILSLNDLSTDDVIECTDVEGFTTCHLLAEHDNILALKSVHKAWPEAFNKMIHSKVQSKLCSDLTNNQETKDFLLELMDMSKIIEASPVKKHSSVNSENIGSEKKVDKSTTESSPDIEKQLRDKLRQQYDNEGHEELDVNLMEEMTVVKNTANGLVSESKWIEAIELYQDIMNKCPHTFKSQIFRSRIVANLSLCYLKTKEIEKSLEFARHAVALDCSWWKAYVRLANALAESGDYEEACHQIYSGMLIPNNDDHTKKLLKGFLDSYVIEARKKLSR